MLLTQLHKELLEYHSLSYGSLYQHACHETSTPHADHAFSFCIFTFSELFIPRYLHLHNHISLLSSPSSFFKTFFTGLLTTSLESRAAVAVGDHRYGWSASLDYFFYRQTVTSDQQPPAKSLHLSDISTIHHHASVS